MKQLIQFTRACPVVATEGILVALLLTCFALSPQTEAVVPPPDGGYPNFNTAEGQNALFSLTTGSANTAVGWFSLWSNAEGSFNTATGAGALVFNTGDSNTAFGAAALLFNTTGSEHTAVGTQALFSNTEGAENTATGYQALASNTTGSFNTANGHLALNRNTTGSWNTAAGRAALTFNTTGNANTAIGEEALVGNVEGSENTAIGLFALGNNTSGSANVALGVGAGNFVNTANNVICIGANVSGANVSNYCYIGNIYSNVQPIVGTDPDSVTIASNGRLGRGNVSSRRYKHDIKPMDKASEALYALKPVSFRYNEEYDATQTLAFGLVAEEVAEVYPDLVGRNPQGEPESVRYEQINAMLLNEFLKEHQTFLDEHRTVQEQGAAIAALKKEIETLTTTVKEQAAQIQKVSTQIELNRPAAQRVALRTP